MQMQFTISQHQLKMKLIPKINNKLKIVQVLSNNLQPFKIAIFPPIPWTMENFYARENNRQKSFLEYKQASMEGRQVESIVKAFKAETVSAQQPPNVFTLLYFLSII